MDREPDGYAIVLTDKASPVGYWFTHAFSQKEIADKEFPKLVKQFGKSVQLKPFVFVEDDHGSQDH